MKQGSTHILRGALAAVALVVLALCIFAMPSWLRMEDDLEYRMILRAMYATVIPFFIALYQAMKLLNFIDKNGVFSDQSVKSLKTIAYCAVAISIIYAATLPFFYSIAEVEDAPGVMLIGLVLTSAPIVIAVFAGLLQKLLQNAIDIKSENDLTV